MGGPNQNKSDKKNPAKGGVWVDGYMVIQLHSDLELRNILVRTEPTEHS